MLHNLKVGAAKRCISPTPDMLPIPNMVGQFEDVRQGEDIMVRAILVDNGERLFLFEGWELSGVPCDQRIRKLLESKFHLAQENMFLTGNHNHSAPFVNDHAIPAASDRDDRVDTEIQAHVDQFTELVIAQSIAVVEDALQTMRPARYGYGEGKSYINVNRDQLFDEGFETPYWMQGANYEGCSDKTLSVLKFVDEEDHLIAAVLNYAMHSTTSFCTLDSDGKMKVTCDAPGIASKFVEDFYGGEPVVLWQSGAAGNQNPNYVGIKAMYDSKGFMRERRRIPGAAYEQGVVLGQQHGMDAIRILKATSAHRSKMRITTVDSLIDFPTQVFPEGIDRGAHRIMVDNLQEWAGTLGENDPMPPKKLAEMIPSQEHAPMKVQLILLGDVLYYGMGCELYNEIAVLCKQASPFKHTVITTHIGTPSVGYVLDDDSVTHRVFQSFGLVPAGCNNGIVVNGMCSLIDQLLEQDN